MKTNSKLNTIFWRWHFYAALFITPLLITLTLTGIGYLFKSEVEDYMYKDLFFGKSTQTEQISIEQSIKTTEEQFEGYKLKKVIYLNDDYNTRFTIANEEGTQKYIFIDSNNQIVGSQTASTTFSNLMRDMHSSLFIGGTFVNYLVELAACWAIFLIISGLYMSFRNVSATVKNNSHHKRQRYKRMHSIIGIVIAVPMIIVIFTGLPWSAFMGKNISDLAKSNVSLGYPALKSAPPKSDMNEIPWITRKDAPPNSSDSGIKPVSITDMKLKIEAEKISKPYTIILPAKLDGSYLVSKSSNTGITGLDVDPHEEMTAYFDQYSGKLISKFSFSDYGIIGKWFSWGIPLHEGHLFGWPNKIINLIVMLAFLFIIYWGFKMWLVRKVKGRLSAPPKQPLGKSLIAFGIILVILGLFMPLFGFSLIVISVIEFLRFMINRKYQTV